MVKRMALLMVALACLLVPGSAFAEEGGLLAGGSLLEPAASTTLAVEYPYADDNSDGKNDYVLEVGQLSNYFSYSYLNPKTTSGPVDGAMSATFTVKEEQSYYYRVTNPSDSDAVTYGNYITIAKGSDNVVAVNTADMHVGDASFDKGTVFADFSRNIYDTGDIYLNVGPSGHVQMQEGDTFSLYPVRNWLPIAGQMDLNSIEPDFHVEVIDLDGTDAVAATEQTASNSGKHKWVLKANHAGTALVKVTYDAMTFASAMGGKTDFGAIWPENTGLFVVTVGQSDDVEVSFELNAAHNARLAQDNAASASSNNVFGTQTKVAGDALDAEFDVLYYTGAQGASYSFSVESGANVSVARGSATGGALSIGAFTDEGVSVAADGSATVENLTTGKHVIRVEKGGNVAYQVVRARELHYALYAGKDTSDASKLISDSDDGEIYAYTDGSRTITAEEYKALTGTERSAFEPLAEPGGTITVVFDTLHHPVGKASNHYNMSASIVLEGADGTLFSQTASPYGGPGQYTFASTASCQKVQFKLPASVQQGAYALDCMLRVGGFGWGGYGSHRQITYETGTSNGAGVVNAPSYTAYFGQVPSVELYVVADIDPAVVAQRAADEFIALVDAIGTVDADAAERIAAARAAYDALDDAARALVPASVLASLESAEAELAALTRMHFQPVDIAAGHVRVIVENGTWAASAGAPWGGVLLDRQVAIDPTSDTMRTLVDRALSDAGLEAPVADASMVHGIKGLGDPDSGVACAGSAAGWMVMLNGWFINESMTAFEAYRGKIREGDEIHLVYTCDGGADVGSSANVKEKSLIGIATDTGTLAPAFSASVRDYVLYVPKGTATIHVKPYPKNANFQARTYLGDADVYEDGCRPNDPIAVQEGTVLNIVVGDEYWPSMVTDSSFAAEKYRVTLHTVDTLKATLSYDPVELGKTAELKATVSDPYATLVWQVSTDKGASWSDVDGAEGLTYSTVLSQENLGSWYRVKASLPVSFASAAYSNPIALTARAADNSDSSGSSDSPSPSSGSADAEDEADAKDAAAQEKAAADRKAADAVTSAIAKLPAAADVTDANTKAVAAARATYDALTPAQKKLVSAVTLKKLKAAEKAVKTTFTFNKAKCTKAALAKALKKVGKKPGAIKKVILGPKVKRIGKGAFADFKKAKTLVVKTKKLKKATVSGSLANSKVKTVKVSVGKAKANKKFVKQYKLAFTKKNCGKKVAVKM